jgi:hypothetical protein
MHGHIRPTSGTARSGAATWLGRADRGTGFCRLTSWWAASQSMRTRSIASL